MIADVLNHSSQERIVEPLEQRWQSKRNRAVSNYPQEQKQKLVLNCEVCLF